MSFTSRLSSSPAGMQHEYEWLVSSSAPPAWALRDPSVSGPERSHAYSHGFQPHILSDVASEEGEDDDRPISINSSVPPIACPAASTEAHRRGVPSGLARAARGLLLGPEPNPVDRAASLGHGSTYDRHQRLRSRTTYGALPRSALYPRLSRSFDEPSQIQAAASADAPTSIFHARDIDPVLGSTGPPTQEDIEQTLEGLSRDVSQSGLARASGFTPSDIARWKRNARSKQPQQASTSAQSGAPALEHGEQTPLIPPDTDAIDPETAEAFTAPSAAQECRTLIRYSLPITGTHLLEMGVLSTTVFSLGHLGTTGMHIFFTFCKGHPTDCLAELAAASLASMTANVTGFSILSGFVSALDSLLPAAFASDRPWTVGIWTQRMAVLLAVLLVPIALIWCEAERLLLAMRQEPDVARLASQYLCVLIGALPAYAGFETCRRYLQAQKLFVAPTIAVGIAGAINIPLNILLVYGPSGIGIGFLGAPLASLVAYWIMFGVALVQCALAPCSTWAGVSKSALDPAGLKSLWCLGFASTAAMAAEWWAWEITGLLTSYLGTTWLAAQSVLLVTSSLMFQMPYALATATAVRVGNLLGAYAAKHAYVAVRVAMMVAFVAGLCNMLFLVIARNYWGLLFTSDKQVIHIIAQNLPFLAAFQVADAIIAVNGGILRASGRQSVGAYLNLLSYYVLGIPTSIYLMYLGWKLSGIWLGLTLGLVAGAILSTVVVVRTNWDREARNTQDRVSAAACADTDN